LRKVRNKYLIIPGVLLLLLLSAKIIFIISAGDNAVFMGGDSAGYEEPAKGLLQNSRFTINRDNPDIPNIVRTPGYPLLIAAVYGAFGDHRKALMIVQAIILSVTAVLVFAIVMKIASPPYAMAAAILYLMDLNSHYMSLLVMTETFFTFLLTASIFILVSVIKHPLRLSLMLPAAGFLLGYAILVRPIAVFFPLIFLVVLGIHFAGRRVSPAGTVAWCFLFLLPVIALCGTWMVRNHARTGTWEISTIGSKSLLLYQAADIIARQRGLPIEGARAVLLDSLSEEPAPRSFLSPEFSRAARKLAVSIIRNHPLAFVRNQIIGSFRVMLSPGVAGFACMTGVNPEYKNSRGDRVILDMAKLNVSRYIERHIVQRPVSTAITFYGLFFLAVLYAGIGFGFFRVSKMRSWLRCNPAVFILVSLCVIYLVILNPGVAGAESRFRTPVMPYLVIASSFGWAGLFRLIKRKKNNESQNI